MNVTQVNGLVVTPDWLEMEVATLSRHGDEASFISLNSKLRFVTLKMIIILIFCIAYFLLV
jgi:hypothetical protein